MPLLDHFRPPLDDRTSWEGFHGQWPAMIVIALNRKLPPRYAAEPRVHLGASFEIDVSAYDEDEPDSFASGHGRGRGRRRDRDLGPAAAHVRCRHGPAGPGRIRGPGLRHEAAPPPGRGRRDRQPGQQGPAREPPRVRGQVCGPAPAAGLGRDRRPGHDAAVQPVRRPARADRPDGPRAGAEPPPLYAAACRWTRPDEAWRFETWTHALGLGQPLPTLPLWLADNFAVPLELEASYEETCRILRLV